MELINPTHKPEIHVKLYALPIKHSEVGVSKVPAVQTDVG